MSKFTKEPLSITLTFRCSASEKEELDQAMVATGKATVVEIIREGLDLWFEKNAKSIKRKKNG